MLKCHLAVPNVVFLCMNHNNNGRRWHISFNTHHLYLCNMSSDEIRYTGSTSRTWKMPIIIPWWQLVTFQPVPSFNKAAFWLLLTVCSSWETVQSGIIQYVDNACNIPTLEFHNALFLSKIVEKTWMKMYVQKIENVEGSSLPICAWSLLCWHGRTF